MKKIFTVLFILIFVPASFAAEPVDLGEISVIARRALLLKESYRSSYSRMLLGEKAALRKSSLSPVDLLEDFPGADLRFRSPQGVQGDLSIRGSTYEQVAVAIDGVKLMDPQTGHFNLDIPLTVFDLGQIEVITQGASALYGAGALAGGVNFVTKRPVAEKLFLQGIFGGHALRGQAFSYARPGEDYAARISFEHKSSKAARPNTDFQYRTATLQLYKDYSALSLDTLFGYQKKDYGADSFYSNLYPEEEEHTETFLYKTSLSSRIGRAELKNDLYLRKHRDKFILQRNRPDFVNYHTTYVYAANNRILVPWQSHTVSLGLDVGRDQINSGNLGKHSRLFEALYAGFDYSPAGRLSASLSLRTDHYEKWPWQESFNLGATYKIFENKLKLRSSISRAFRLPTFTELYYRDPANIGNPDLGPEHSYDYSLGLDYKGERQRSGIEGFLRQADKLIDWTRRSELEPWRAGNLGRADFRGGVIKYTVEPAEAWGPLFVRQAGVGYTYIDVSKKASGFLSKYALDALKHQLLFELQTVILGADLDWQLSYNQRYYGESYFVGNFFLGRKIYARGFSFEPFCQVSNFTNSKYSETSGVLQPGRWFKGGLKFAW